MISLYLMLLAAPLSSSSAPSSDEEVAIPVAATPLAPPAHDIPATAVVAPAAGCTPIRYVVRRIPSGSVEIFEIEVQAVHTEQSAPDGPPLPVLAPAILMGKSLPNGTAVVRKETAPDRSKVHAAEAPSLPR